VTLGRWGAAATRLAATAGKAASVLVYGGEGDEVDAAAKGDAWSLDLGALHPLFECSTLSHLLFAPHTYPHADAASWSRVSGGGDGSAAGARKWHAMVSLPGDGAVLAYGGDVEAGTDDAAAPAPLVALDTSLMLWYPPTQAGRVPPSRSGHSMASFVDPTTGALFC